ncbi:N-acetyltransferase family protein [Fictibacillus sp. S7]|uniref:GNAT family N-acetyltransferase n=1 Tax=Fictibacillus sp. S7 TaxID=2212476 RepID=UPI002686B8A0
MQKCSVNGMIIRRPEKADQEELNQLFITVIKHTFKKEGISHLTEEMEEEMIQKKDFLQRDFTRNGEEYYFLIAVDVREKKMIGTISYGPANALIINCTNRALKDWLEIGTVYVHPDYQKQGVGTALLNHLFADMKGKGINQFCLDSGYKQAQMVWRKKLGEPKYVMKDYWGEGSHHMIWAENI